MPPMEPKQGEAIHFVTPFPSFFYLIFSYQVSEYFFSKYFFIELGLLLWEKYKVNC